VPAAAQLSPQSMHSGDWALWHIYPAPVRPLAVHECQFRVCPRALPACHNMISKYDTPALLRGALALDVLNCRVQF
jgi:hypothetical protein